MCVTELADFVETGHKRNYASAAYLAAVENTECGAHFKLHPADFIEVMNQLDFVEIATVLVPGEQRADQTGSRSRLSELIDTVLQKLSGEDFCLAYKKGSHSELLFHADDESSVFESFESSTREISRKTEEDDLSGTPGQSMAGIETELSDDEVEEKDDSLDGDLEIERPRPSSFGTAPMFVRFLLDGKPASVQDLASVDRSASLSALVSVYSESEHGDNKIHEGNLSDLPSSHVNVAAEMGSLLNAYVAEQTLERLRHHGPSIEEADLRLARTCLRKARYVMASTIDVYFYASKSDTMVPASAPAGANAEVEEGFKILSVQLLKNEHDTLKSFGDGNSFFVVDAGSEGAILAYLCFVRLRRSRGTIAVEVYHPEGPRQASFVLERMHNTISHCCHRTNQIMLLNRLHRSRTASSLLILQDPETSADKNKGIESQLRDPFYPGVFSCPILFRTSFDLFHRCATNPAQVARTVEATVLHIFSISNRRSVFGEWTVCSCVSVLIPCLL